MEQDFPLLPCFSGGSGCVITPSCQLKSIFGEALEAFFGTLSKYTLADLLPTGGQPELVQLLQMVNAQR